MLNVLLGVFIGICLWELFGGDMKKWGRFPGDDDRDE